MQQCSVFPQISLTLRLQTLALLLLAATCTLTSDAQSIDTRILTGRVLDAETGEPIPLAHVGIAQRAIGTTSGFDGRFELKLPAQVRDAPFSISCIGYTTYRVPLSQYRDGATIPLVRSVTGLAEVVVVDGSAALNIVRQAVAAIPRNYPSAPNNSLVFYRESLTDDSLRYKYLAEGVLEVHKSSYAKSGSGEVGVVQGRKINLLDPLDTTVRSGFTSGHMAAHRFDFVKNREDFIDEAFMPVYNYSLSGMTTYDDRPVYIIAFEPAPAAERTADRRRKRSLIGRITGGLLGRKSTPNAGRIEPRLRGKLYIEQGSYAFVRAEFEVTQQGLRRYNDYPLYSGRWRANNYVVNYRKSADSWYFSDALRAGIYQSGEHYANEVKTTQLMEGKGHPIPYLERVDRNDRFVSLTGRYVEDFWRDYNVLPMSEGLAQGMLQYRTMRTAEQVFSPAYQDSLRGVRDSMRNEALAAEALARRELEEFDPEVDPDLPSTTIVIDDFGEEDSGSKVRSAFNLGAHLLSSTLPPLSVVYGDETAPSALAASGAIGTQNIEALFQWDLDISLHRNAFVRLSTASDFGESIYKMRGAGVGAELNLRPKHRPIIIRGVAQYSWLRYYRSLGEVDIPGRRVEIADRNFRGKALRVAYGNHQHRVSLSGELSVETRRGREVFVRGTYHHGFAARAGVWFKETGQLFRKDERVVLPDALLSVSSGGEQFSEVITPEGSWSVSVGILFD